MKGLLFILSLTIIIIFSSCKSNHLISEDGSLIVNSWKLREIHRDTSINSNSGKKLPVLRFEKDGNIFGRTGCNIISGKYFIKDNNIYIRLRAFKRRGCSNIENDLIVSLSQTSSFLIKDNELILKDSEKYLLTFSSLKNK